MYLRERALQNGEVSPESPLGRAQQLLRTAADTRRSRAERAKLATELAEALLALSEAHTAPADRDRARMLARLMDDRAGQLLTAALTDRVFRSRDPRRSLDEVAHLLRRHGVPKYMRLHERAALSALWLLAPSGLAALARAVTARVREQARPLLLDAEERSLDRHLNARRREGARVNVNELGEALLGEREAEQRVEKYVELAQRPRIDALSVKVSSVASQLNLLAFGATADLVAARLARIYRATLSRSESERPVVVLDMEAYVHTELTLAALERALATPELDRVRAGVVLQAYLPDSHEQFTRVRQLAAERVARGGLPLRLRIVKGANLAHERVESEKAGVTLPIFPDKLSVDASYKRLLERAGEAASAGELVLGVASHNLFDLAYALILRAEYGAGTSIELELLEGMADPLRRALATLDVGLLLYAPVCHDEELNSGIAYLVRRLDENTASDNYLRASFTIAAGRDAQHAAFARERARFLAAIGRVDHVDETPRRSRDRGFDRSAEPPPPRDRFRGEVDTDFSRGKNRLWIAAALEQLAEEPPRLLTSRIAGARGSVEVQRDGVDPSRPGVVPYRFALASASEVEQALATAAADPAGYSRWTDERRSHLLLRIADALRAARAELIATVVLDGGKRVAEADVEVSEAIDFADYYRASFMELARSLPVEFAPRGVVLVTPPWNFPLAIAAGGAIAALMAGCRVLFKPALETPLVGARIAELLYQAGVPESALQLILCEDEVASALVGDARVDTTILTGATSTARLFQRLRPGLRLLAETGGKNAYIVSVMSDRELAIRDVVSSAFGHAGQKCSAASLLICEEEVYVDPRFRATLRDAVESLPVGSAWDPRSFVTPLIRQPEQPLLRALTTLEPGEEWLVAPRIEPDNPRLVHPGVKLGVKPGSFTHTTELFGPVLGVMRARSLEHAVELANATGYGLTAGLASLDEREHDYFCEHVRAGNLYVNRTTTGAIVERQPFGGIANSGFGPGAKAGGPNYVAQLCRVRELSGVRADGQRRGVSGAILARVLLFARTLDAEAAAHLHARCADYQRALLDHFAREHEPAPVLGQHNRFRYRPCERLVLRVERDAAPLDIASSCLAAELVGAGLIISMDPGARMFQDASVLGHPLRIESAAALVDRPVAAPRMRLLGSRSADHDALNELVGVHIADEPVLSLGRLELLHYLYEQSLSIEYHRYGNLGDQGAPRQP